MSNLQEALKTEITRVSRKQIKEEVAPLRKSSSAFRHDIANLKKRVKDLESMVARLVNKEPRKQASLPTVTPEKPVRWSPAKFSALRQKLKLSAKDMGLIIGVSPKTIYDWEDANSATRPRASHMPKIVAARALSAAKAKKLLQELSA